MSLRVECYSGYRAEEEPRRIHLPDGVVEVAGILARALEPGRRRFTVRGTNGRIYRLVQDRRTGVWSLSS